MKLAALFPHQTITNYILDKPMYFSLIDLHNLLDGTEISISRQITTKNRSLPAPVLLLFTFK
ncbi:hypothetical protein COK38_06095 [Bacillus cereus]|uniref:Uncharacterized protein n=1 Tax=Bacillus cereus TaxID=1396 RepID=A0AA44QCI1_BACCE|nr:hypothetical protein COK38_06095 [Bacillus cereus]